MLEILTPRPRSRSIIIVSLLLTIQGFSLLVFAVLTSLLGISAVRNATADHKPTAAALSTAIALLGGGFFLVAGLFAFYLAWEMWKQKSWAFWGSAILEGLSLFLSLALLCGGIIWLLISVGVLAVVILVFLFADRQVRVALDIPSSESRA
jgi:uncharacterized membrane protein